MGPAEVNSDVFWRELILFREWGENFTALEGLLKTLLEIILKKKNMPNAST